MYFPVGIHYKGKLISISMYQWYLITVDRELWALILPSVE